MNNLIVRISVDSYGFTAVDIEIFKESISTDMSIIDKNHILLSGNERLGYFVKF